MAAIDDVQPSHQGAEARVYVSEFYGRPCIIKERFVKTYRVPELDQKLTQRRISQVSLVLKLITCVNTYILLQVNMSATHSIDRATCNYHLCVHAICDF